MDITAEMLFYRLSERHRLRREYIGTPGFAVRGIRFWRTGEKLEENILYLLEDGTNLDKVSGRNPVIFLLSASSLDEGDNFLPKDTYAVLEEKMARKLQVELLELLGALTRWDARFYEAAIHRESAERIMAWGGEMLKWAYAVIDLDMKILYHTPNYQEFAGARADQVPQEITQELMMNPDFHAVAKLRESFYYFEENNGLDALCGNIFLGGAYYARVVMYVGEKGTRVPAGA